MPGLEPQRRGDAYNEAVSTVEKAVEKDRELIVGKDGKLKTLGFFRNIFLQFKISCLSDRKYSKYCQQVRNPVRDAVLNKLEGLAKDARREAISSSFSEDAIEQEKQGIENFVEAFTEERKKRYNALRKSNDFNREALDFLKDSNNVTYARKPVAPDFYKPDEQGTQDSTLHTTHEKSEIKKYQRSQRIYKHTLASKKVLKHVDFRENQKLSAKVSERPKTTRNKKDFKTHAEKRVVTEIARRERRRQAPVGEKTEGNTIDFLCFLRQQVQKKFTGKGELPEQFQALFNENSAVSIPGSRKEPDRLIPSKKLATLAVDLCTGDHESGLQISANSENNVKSKPLAFSDVVGVQEIASSDVNQQLHRYAALKRIQVGTGINAVIKKKLILSERQQKQLFPETLAKDLVLPGDEEIENIVPSYEEGEVPEDHEKYSPHGGEYPAAANRADNGGLRVATRQIGTEGTREITGADGWVKEQYMAWCTSQLS